MSYWALLVPCRPLHVGHKPLRVRLKVVPLRAIGVYSVADLNGGAVILAAPCFQINPWFSIFPWDQGTSPHCGYLGSCRKRTET